MTVTSSFKGQAGGVGPGITSNALTVLTGDFLTMAASYPDSFEAASVTITNTGTVIIWTKQLEVTAASNCKVILWTATAGATPPTTVTATVASGNPSVGLYIAMHTGAHPSNPLPSGNIFSGTGGTDVSQAVTPTASGSALHMMAGDWSETNSFAAIANCSLAAAAFDTAGSQTVAAFKPTTQPRTDGAAFTIGETDTAGKITWAVWEVQAAATGAFTFAHNSKPRPAAFRPGNAR